MIKMNCSKCGKEVTILKPFSGDDYVKMYCLECHDAVSRKDKRSSL